MGHWRLTTRFRLLTRGDYWSYKIVGPAECDLAGPDLDGLMQEIQTNNDDGLTHWARVVNCRNSCSPPLVSNRAIEPSPLSTSHSESGRVPRDKARGTLPAFGRVSDPGMCGLTTCRKPRASKAFLLPPLGVFSGPGGWPPITGTLGYSVIKLPNRMAHQGPGVAESGLWRNESGG